MENEAVFFPDPWVSQNSLIVGAFLLILIFCLVLLSLRRHYLNTIESLKQQPPVEVSKPDTQAKESEESEPQILKFLNEQLKTELESKSRELANSAMSIVFKNELLNKIRQEIYDLKDAQGKNISSDQLRKIDKIINEAISKEGDWNLFEKSFNDAHQNFFKKLKANYQTLAPNDLKLCAFLRMNMNSKEIASLLNISLRGVEIRRYRLRKKLEVSHDKNLSEFLLEI